MDRESQGIPGGVKNQTMKVLFITPYPKEGPSSRYRVEQFIPYLEAKGCSCRVQSFMSSKCYKIVYKKGHLLGKLSCLFFGIIKRIIDFSLALRSDVIFIHLEAYPFGPPIFEYALSILGKKIIYDLDDAIYLKRSGKLIELLKCSWKIKEIIKLSRSVITCNDFLANYALKFNRNVSVVHTSVDTQIFTPTQRELNRQLTIGWIGSHSTLIYLQRLKNVLAALSKKYDFTLKVIGAQDSVISMPGVKNVNINWTLDGEVRELQSFDIGLYPLPNEQWVLGKTGFKTIQYMSVGIPAVVSDVGANKSIIVNGVNGFCVDTDDQWVDVIGKLIEDPNLRKSVGMAGRKAVEEKYSLRVSAPRIYEIIQKTYEGK